MSAQAKASARSADRTSATRSVSVVTAVGIAPSRWVRSTLRARRHPGFVRRAPCRAHPHCGTHDPYRDADRQRGNAMHKIALEEHFMLPEFVDYWSTTFENISPELAGKALGALSD